MRIDPTVIEVAAGQTAAVQFVLADAQNAYGIDVRATFDPKVVEVMDADPGADGVQMTPGDFLRPDFVVRNVADNEKGTLRYTLTQVNPTQPVSGTGVIFTVQFRGKTTGETALTLVPVELADRQGQLLPATVEGGTIRVVADQAPTPVPDPTQPAPTAAPVVATGAHRGSSSDGSAGRCAGGSGRADVRRRRIAARRGASGSGGVGRAAPQQVIG